MIWRRHHTFYSLLFVVAALRVWISTSELPVIIAPALHDDRLFMSQAQHILQGQWLGPFHMFTLIKGAFFPIFLAINHITSIPLLVTQQLLHCAAALVLAVGLRRLGISEWLIILLTVFLVFDPSFGSSSARRIIRDNLSGSLSLAMFACLTVAVANLETGRRYIHWICSAGILTGLLCVTREEGIYLVPALLFFAAYFLWRSRKSGKSRTVIVAFGAAIILFLLPRFAISSQNKRFYGERLLTEFQWEPFQAAYGALLRAGAGAPFRQYVLVPQSVRLALYESSPAFRTLKGHLEGSRWIDPGCIYIQPCDDLSSHFLWAFREAVSSAGHYRSLEGLKTFYQELAYDIYEACEYGVLTCSPPHDSMTPPWRREYLPLLLSRGIEAIRYLTSFRETEPGFSVVSVGQRKDIASLLTVLNYNPRFASLLLDEGRLRSHAISHRLKTIVLKKSVQFFQRVGGVFSVVSFTCFLLAVALFRKYPVPEVVIAFGALLLISTRLAVLTYIDVTSFRGINNIYNLPVYPILISFWILSVAAVLHQIRLSRYVKLRKAHL